MHGCFAPAHETGTLRKFQHGRTDTIRATTMESNRYCYSMVDSRASEGDRAGRLREAIDAHRKYTALVGHVCLVV